MTLNSNKYALEIKKLTKVYKVKKGKEIIKALNEVNFNVAGGKIMALLGPNGAGKSTLIGILACLVNKTSGNIRINGFDLDLERREAKMSIGVVPQELVIDPYFTPRETMDIQAGLYGISKKNKKTDQLIDILGLTDKADSYTRNLSGGMKRRLMIAKAMVHDPKILILDEPTAGVDVELRKSLWENIKLLNKSGKTILLTTHYIEEAEAICNEVTIINNGMIITQGNTDELVSRLDQKELIITLSRKCTNLNKSLLKAGCTLLDENNMVIKYNPSKINAGELLNLLYKNDIKVKEISSKEPNLEEVFIKLVQKK